MHFLQQSSYPNTLAFLFGGIAALGFAPLFWWPCTFVAFLSTWFLFENKHIGVSPWKSAFFGWCFGCGYFVVGLYWITNALTVDLPTLWWLVPFSLFGLPALLAVFIALPFLFTTLWAPLGGARPFVFVAAWGGAEWLRAHIFTGFPWNLLGYIWGSSPEMSQLASLVGVYGLGLLTLLVMLSWEWLWVPSLKKKIICGSLCLMTAGVWVWGHQRLLSPELLPSAPVALRLVQPNIPQTLKWDPAEKEKNFQKLLGMTSQPSEMPLKAVIWPESAMSFFLEYAPLPRHFIASRLPKGALLFTGALRRTAPDVLPLKLWNSLLVLDDTGEIIAHYDKFHLVPFGEYIPFRRVWDTLLGEHSLKKITAGGIDFTPGEGPQTISLPEGFPPFSGLVCYEVIFPHAVIPSTLPRPAWLVNITNDAWYGKSSGPYQHLESTRFRAIEEGIPLVRCANSGISAVFDAYGRTVGSLPLSQEGILDVVLPAPLKNPPPYSQKGDLIPWALILTLLICGWFLSFMGERRQNE